MSYCNPFSLEGKIILVTGASSGIGRGVAIACSNMGAYVILTARNEQRLKESQNHMIFESSAIMADCTAKDDIEALVKNVPEIDGVVHCAGIGDRTLLKMVRDSDIERVMNCNFKAPVLLQKELLKKKKIKDCASIVFVASRAPFAPSIGNGIYAASKAAIIAYSKVLGLELAQRKIRVNCICPAMVWTEFIERDAILTGVDYHMEELKYPLKRYGRPEDVANLAVYMLSDASSWMTGSCVDITGGANSL